MNLRILAILIFYYTMILAVGTSMQFLDPEFLPPDYTTTNDTIVLDDLDDSVDIVFHMIPYAIRVFGFITLGVGLPAGVPGIVQVLFILWQSSLTLFVIGFIVSAIWDG